MHLAVCLKQVPDTAEMRLDPVTHTLLRDGAEAILNPLDAFPLEAALRLREACGGRVTVLSMGPPQASRVLEQALAMGADDAVLLCDRAFAGADTWATSLTLAKGLEYCGPFDVVLCGKQAIDGDTGQVGPGIAAHLGIAQVAGVTRILGCKHRVLHLERLLDHGTEELEVPAPVVLTVLKEANEPRLPTLSGLIRALGEPPRVLTAADLGLSPEQVGLKGSPTRVARVTVPQTTRQRRRIDGTPAEAAQEFLAYIRNR